MIQAAISIIGAIGSLISKPIARYQERKTAEHEATVKRITQGDNSAAELDRVSIVQRGWKDEYLLLITTAPLVLLFIAPIFGVAGLTEAVTAGFESLKQTPEFYWWALAVVYIDTFGFRRMVRVAVEHWLRAKWGTSVVSAPLGKKETAKTTATAKSSYDFSDSNG